jgi:diguanylate cyclase (GGDEF)-like protein
MAEGLSVSRLLQRLAKLTGIAGLPRRALHLIILMTIIAAGVSIAGPSLSDGPILMPAEFFAVAGLFVLAHLLGTKMVLGSSTIHVAWGEAAVIIGFTMLPAAWMPAAVGLGILVASLILSYFTGRTPIECLRASAALTISAGVAAALVGASGIGNTTGQFPVVELTPFSALVLATAAIFYLLCTAVLMAAHLALRDGQPMLTVVWSALRGTPVMIVGNLALGLLAALLWQNGEDPAFALVLPPLLWLLRQLYAHRFREDEERRKWRSFAVASRSLHRLDEVAVAQEGVRSARAIFEVHTVELVVFSSRTVYRLDPASPQVTVAPWTGPIGEDTAHTRLLEVAGGLVGSLTLIPAMPGVWAQNDQHRIAAFGDALAAALHDAATHSALRDLRERTSFESSHDPLTRLMNRDTLLEKGHSRLRACEPQQPVALILFDLDNFKAVNDTLGHLAGDELLQLAAGRLEELIEPGELVARLGGDEFALLMTELPPDDSAPLDGATSRALRRARELTTKLAAPAEVAGVTLSAEVSAGVVVATASAAGVIELLRRADIALYQAKESGVRATTYLPGRDGTSTDRLALAAELQGALASTDQLSLVLQPTIDLRTGAPIGVEALVRWQHPRRGLLTPIHFIRAVEASDLLGQFTRVVLDRALGVAARLAKAGLELPVSVNLSPRSLLDPQLPEDLGEMLREHGVPAENLILEITETVVLSPLRVTDQVLHALRELGVRFAVDDFGTGYSSLTFLTRIAVDELKVDRTFVAKMGTSRETAAIVRAVVDLGNQLGMRVVAEGVETAEQRNALVKLGCHAGQGFYFGRAVAEEEIVEDIVRLRAAIRPLRIVSAEQTG